MKKIYSFVLMALAGGFVANAQQQANFRTVDAEEAGATVAAPATHVVAATEQYRTRAAQDMMGSFIWSYRTGLAGGQSGTQDTITLTLNQGTTDQVKVSGIWNGDKASFVTGTLDVENGTLTIPRVAFGKNASTGKYRFLELFDWGKKLKSKTDPIVFKYHGGMWRMKDGEVIGIGAHDTEEADSCSSYYMLRYNNEWWGDIEWENLGTTKFRDAFFSPMYGFTTAKGNLVEKDVTVYKAPGADVFKVVGAILVNQSTANPMYIDATNPDNVLVPSQSSNVPSTTRGMTWYCNVAFTSRTPLTPSANVAYATYKDGVITLPARTCRFCWVNYKDASGKDLSKNWYYNGDTEESKLVIPLNQVGVNELDSDNAPVEYYNLQGVKVANPENGIFVRRQGNKTTKVIF